VGDSPRIGEIWFASNGAPLELMIKYIFTSEKLSVQVHPSDEQARDAGLLKGKEECWYILDAEPGATVGIGTVEKLSDDELREASLSGSIEQLLDWKPVKVGDFFYISAGTVHAIGAGVSLIEIQQNSDITYRLFDYGRPRELHLDAGVGVSNAEPYADTFCQHFTIETQRLVVDGPKFRLAITGGDAREMPGTGPYYLIPLKGEIASAGQVAGTGEVLVTDNLTELTSSDGARMFVARACMEN
jgi:mannose-6-phosphate isomerase